MFNFRTYSQLSCVYPNLVENMLPYSRMSDTKIQKIIIFSTTYYPFASGAEMAVKEISDRKPGIGFDLITARFNLTLPRFERIGNVNVYRVGLGIGGVDKFLLPFLGFLKAERLNKKNNYRVIWSLMASQASIGAVFFKLKNKTKKLVLTLQEGDEESYLKRYVLGIDFLYKLLIKPWHTAVFKKADAVVAISGDLKKRALRNGVKKDIAIIPNGVDFDNFQRYFSEEELQKIRDEIKISKGDKLIIHTGRLVEKNSLNSVIESLKYLPGNVKFLSLGIGPDLDALRDLAEDLGVENRIIFWKFVSHQKMAAYLKIANVFCRPSLSEGLGSSFLEAMAAGVPVVATPVGGIPDFLTDGETGWFCKVNDPESIAEKIRYILDGKNAEEVKRVVGNARKMVEEKYNWDGIAEKMEMVFREWVTGDR